MSNLMVPGKKLQIEATTETRTAEHTPRPTLVLRIRGQVHHKIAKALAHQIASHLEFALVNRGLESLVEIGEPRDWFKGRTRLGSVITIGLELVGDDKRIPLTIEHERAKDVIETAALWVNAGPAF